MKQSPYIIDTNILINFRIFTPMNIHVTFWRQLSEAVENKAIIIIQDVADECTRRDELKIWVNKQKIEKVTQDVRDRAFEIDNEYSLITQEKEIIKSEADPVIIAYAEKHSGIVFTRESKRKSKDMPMKIPDVCKALSIEYRRSPDHVFRNIKFKPIINYGTIQRIS